MYQVLIGGQLTFYVSFVQSSIVIVATTHWKKLLSVLLQYPLHQPDIRTQTIARRWFEDYSDQKKSNCFIDLHLLTPNEI